ncbi:hypothetical protein [Marinobacter subterrani]|uniref:hypothetical protein n=1 Tax=Marinobacter subterrani TaxID=1658765 RepID=UPI0023550F16|nr:hypothetical protein [Marinobacter subterrani]
MGKGKSSSNGRLTPQAARDKTTTEVGDKISFIQEQLEGRKSDPLHGLPEDIREEVQRRLNNPFHGLPRSVKAFCELTKLPSVDATLKEIPRATLTGPNGRADLHDKVKDLVSSVKSANVQSPESLIAEIRKERDQAEKEIAGLAGVNHEMHLKIEELKRELRSAEAEVESLTKQLIKRSKIQNIDPKVTPFRRDSGV